MSSNTVSPYFSFAPLPPLPDDLMVFDSEEIPDAPSSSSQLSNSKQDALMTLRRQYIASVQGAYDLTKCQTARKELEKIIRSADSPDVISHEDFYSVARNRWQASLKSAADSIIEVEKARFMGHKELHRGLGGDRAWEEMKDSSAYVEYAEALEFHAECARIVDSFHAELHSEA